MIPLDVATAKTINGFDPMRLQYWPETLAWDRGQIGWQQKMMPGLSHPLFSWTSNGAPTVSFEIVFTADVDPAYMAVEYAEFAYAAERNVNINAACAWLNAATNPEYFEQTSQQLVPVSPPPIIQLVTEYSPPSSTGESLADELSTVIGGSNIVGGARSTASNPLNSRIRGVTLSHHPGRDFYGVITSLNFNYLKFFTSGAPKIVRAAITLAEVIQIGDFVLPHNRRTNLEMAKEYNLLDRAAASAIRSSENIS